ncbi:unnamed protein product [Calypogeia fissa]
MNLAIVSALAPPELHSHNRTENVNLKACRRRRASTTFSPVISCFTSSSASSSPSSSSSSSSSASSSPQGAATAIATPPVRRSQEPPRDLAKFKPPPPAPPDSAQKLATELPFQYWYSYADLPPGIPKKRQKNPLAIRTSKDKDRRDFRDKGGTGRNGNGNGNGSLWETALAIEAEENLDTPKVSKRGRGGSSGDGHLGGVRVTEKGLLLTSPEQRWEGGRETGEDLGEGDENSPVTEEEKKKLILSCADNSRQINVGWDGWNPNYVALVHTYWKRSSICKIKCKGVVTLDLDSFCELVEVETGGKVIHRVGGTVYLFRGRNYNYWKHWKQLIVRFPRILKRFPRRLPVPVSLTKEYIKELRARGRDLPALCKPGKHGVYLTLVDDVRKAFETQDLVRVNCQGFHSKNLKLLGSQLQALVPCELISYEFEHILMWRSKDENSPNDEVKDRSEENCLVSEALS